MQPQFPGIKNCLEKNGYNYSSIIDNWTKWLEKISQVNATLTKIRLDKIKNYTLILNVIHGKEIEVEYERKNIIDKINFFRI